MKRIAIFVDAGYVRAELGALLGGPPRSHAPVGQPALDYQRLHTRLLQEARAQLPDGDLLRVYWYDTPDPEGKTDEHHAIDALDDFKLRLGAPLAAGQASGLAGLITADLLGLAQHRAITHALLVSHDAGLAPGVLAVQAMGVRVHGLSLGATLPDSAVLAAELDHKRQWGAAELHDLLADGVAADAAAEPAALLDWAPATALKEALASFSALGTPAPSPAPRVAPAGCASPEAPAELWLPGAAAAEWSPAALAQAAHAQLQSGPHALVFAALKPGMRALPREIDSALLALGRQALGRALTEPEKRALRREFQGLVRQVFDDRLQTGKSQSPAWV